MSWQLVWMKNGGEWGRGGLTAKRQLTASSREVMVKSVWGMWKVWAPSVACMSWKWEMGNLKKLSKHERCCSLPDLTVARLHLCGQNLPKNVSCPGKVHLRLLKILMEPVLQRKMSNQCCISSHLTEKAIMLHWTNTVYKVYRLTGGNSSNWNGQHVSNNFVYFFMIWTYQCFYEHTLQTDLPSIYCSA